MCAYLKRSRKHPCDFAGGGLKIRISAYAKVKRIEICLLAVISAPRQLHLSWRASRVWYAAALAIVPHARPPGPPFVIPHQRLLPLRVRW